MHYLFRALQWYQACGKTHSRLEDFNVTNKTNKQPSFIDRCFTQTQAKETSKRLSMVWLLTSFGVFFVVTGLTLDFMFYEDVIPLANTPLHLGSNIPCFFKYSKPLL